ncbi:hypothetical protein HMI56_005470 [Coelomomyces lativittatus]|nr:hypothetical protein HMI56_005470 [Coelomomyces lativittatus]
MDSVTPCSLLNVDDKRIETPHESRSSLLASTLTSSPMYVNSSNDIYIYIYLLNNILLRIKFKSNASSLYRSKPMGTIDNDFKRIENYFGIKTFTGGLVHVKN